MESCELAKRLEEREDKNDNAAGRSIQRTKLSKRKKRNARRKSESLEEDADQLVERPESDTTGEVERVKERQMREHAEQPKTATSSCR